MTRACTTAALALLFVVLSASVLAPAQAQAGETIRMALFQNVESVTVASSSGLIVRAPNDTVVSSGRITVAAGPSGLLRAGQPLRSDARGLARPGAAAGATAETRDQVLAYRDEPILAAFSSTAAGLTEDAWNVWSVDLPYLKGVECPFDLNSPWYQWRTDVGLAMLEQRLRDEG